ncbi:hypothetical protein EI555_016638, partial [Monodon monoceros]
TEPSRGTWLKKWLCKKHQDFPRFGGQLGERGRGDLKIMKKIKSNMKVGDLISDDKNTEAKRPHTWSTSCSPAASINTGPVPYKDKAASLER